MFKQLFSKLKEYSKLAIIALVIVFSSALISRATALYSSTTLDPQCAPGDPDCTVSNTPTYTPQGATVNAVGGLASGTNLGTTAVSIQSILDKMLYPYVGPGIGLSINQTTTREVGNTIGAGSVVLTATLTKHTNPITSITFYRSGTAITGCTFANVAGLSATQTCSETNGAAVSANTTYSATVTDGTTSPSASASISFIYPYYYGAGAANLTATQVTDGRLTKYLIGEQNGGSGYTASYTTDSVGGTGFMYFAQPQSYAALKSVRDGAGILYLYTQSAGQNVWGFTSGVTLTNSYGVTGTYRIYSNNGNPPTTLSAYNVVFNETQ